MLPPSRDRRRIYLGVLAYLLAFAAVLVLVLRYYLLPAMTAVRSATPQERRLLAVDSRLLLTVVLFVLFALLLLTFRIGRFFAPRGRAAAKPTAYPDAWAEAGRRARVPPPDSADDDEE